MVNVNSKISFLFYIHLNYFQCFKFRTASLNKISVVLDFLLYFLAHLPTQNFSE